MIVDEFIKSFVKLRNKTIFYFEQNDEQGIQSVQKQDTPYRLIISFINSSLHHFAEFLHKIIIKSIPIADSHISDSFDLVKKLESVKLRQSHFLLSLDVISLFTNVSIDLSPKSIESRWIHIRIKDKDQYLSEFTRAVEFVLTSTYFSFNNTTYKKTFGIPMGFPLSPVIADMVMQESSVLKKLHFQLTFFQIRRRFACS